MDWDVLAGICELLGLEPFSCDAGGKKQPLPADRLRSALAALGENVADERAARQTLDTLEGACWQRVLDPVLVAPEKASLFLTARVPEEALGRSAHWVLSEENGTVHEGDLLLSSLAVQKKKTCGDRRYAAVTLPLATPLPCGYHRFTIKIGDEKERPCPPLSLIVTPRTCYVPPGLANDARTWGISCQPYALRSERNWGIGDFTDLKNLLTWAAGQGAGTLAVGLLNAPLSLRSGRIDLLRPSGRRFLHPLHLDIEAIDDFRESEEAREFAGNPAFQARLANLREQRQVAYDEVAEAKLGVLSLLWKHFRQYHLNPETERGRMFRQFQREGGEESRAHGTFEAIRSRHAPRRGAADWAFWPGPFRDPASAEVAAFAARHPEQIEFHQYIQWQAQMQLAALGRRSMELGLKLGLLQTLPLAVDAAGFETWYHQRLFAKSDEPVPSAVGREPLIIPARLRESAYVSFIAMLRAAMEHAGAIRLNRLAALDRLCWTRAGADPAEPVTVRYPVADLLAIIALESRRNRCMVFGDVEDGMSAGFLDAARKRGIHFCRPGYFEKSEISGELLAPHDYPAQSLVTTSRYDLPTLAGFWQGRDIAIHTELGLYRDGSQREDEIIGRAAERVHLLVALHREGLLPEGYDLDPAAVPQMTPALAQAIQQFLARTPAKVFLLQLDDLLAEQEQAFVPGGNGRYPNWQHKLSMGMAAIRGSDQNHTLLQLLCRERGIGTVRPSALQADRRQNRAASIPRAFYRLQLNKHFTFRQAAALVPYLKELGISHCYASPYLKARPDSAHGYDIIDHSALNPEIGSRQEYEEFVTALDWHGMAQILDMVPNHMGVGSDNRWWLDVLENGPASEYADFFDINWQPQQEYLQGRLLLPVLGDHYGTVLEAGQLQLAFDAAAGAFFVSYYEHRFPIDPGTCPTVLGHDLKRLEARHGAQHAAYQELQNLISSFLNLPGRQETGPEKTEIRRRNKEVLKRLLARLCRESTEIAVFIEENAVLFNGAKGRPETFDLLHDLLSMQAYRLAFWRVAGEEVNYRRFFDINDLAGLRMENPRVFEETHRFVLDLIGTGKIDGLRIDHPDGLYDPDQYCRRLQKAVCGESIDEQPFPRGAEPAEPGRLPLYVVVEKILTDYEQLPESWQVHGTTGYDFANLLNGLFVDPAGEKVLTRVYHRFIGRKIDFDALLHDNKKMIIKTAMPGELNVLAGMLHSLALANRHTRDFTLNSLREALTEIIAMLPVYRTYTGGAGVSKGDRNYIDWAVARARARHWAEDTGAFDFTQTVLLLDGNGGKKGAVRQAMLDFVMKLQQYTGPVMARGLEDTSFYVYNRLLSLNEVGGNPRRFGVSVAAFHHANLARIRRWPHAMLNTSTHDSKRSGDVRARINVLAEMPEEWHAALNRWAGLNRAKKTRISTGLAPSRNDEYALYQTLLGAWPAGEMDSGRKQMFAGRIAAFMLKASREAKVHTSWVNPHPAYEQAVTGFVHRLLEDADGPFLKEFSAFQQKTAWFGALSGMAQTLLKLTAPGVPDIYQGTEIWRFSLVDPDNRRPVDFNKRQAMLADLQALETVSRHDLPQRVRKMLDNLTDGRIKMYIIRQTLGYRRERSEIFREGGYLPLTVQGARAAHICAFARTLGQQGVIVAVPRLLATLLDRDHRRLPLGAETWQDTELLLPEELPGKAYHNILTGETLLPDGGGQRKLPLAGLFANFPVALLGT